jgi:hypothetical protein
MGRFLAYYLKARFGDSQVFTVGQVARARSSLNLDDFASKDVLLPSAQVPWKDAPPDDIDLTPDNFDAFIIRDGFMIPAHPLRYILSKRVLDAGITRLRFSQYHRSGAMGNRLFHEAMSTLMFLGDTSLSTAEEWESWRASHRFDGLTRLHSERFRGDFTEKSSRVLGTGEFSAIIDDLVNMGFDTRVGSPNMTREQWDGYLTSQWPQIVLLNVIGVWSVGEPAEQAAAQEYLIKVSGEHFREPGQYLKWWRHRFFAVAY